MNYLNIISLDQAKLYLKIDDCQSETDSEIENMIKSSLSFIEKRTGHIMFPREKTYYGCNQIFIHDYPINEITVGESLQIMPLYQKVQTVGGLATLNVGYEDSDDIPSELIDAALQMIKVWFYESERQVNSTLIAQSTMEAIDINRRFV